MLKPITTENPINTRKLCHYPKLMKQISGFIMINVFIFFSVVNACFGACT